MHGASVAAELAGCKCRPVTGRSLVAEQGPECRLSLGVSGELGRFILPKTVCAMSARSQIGPLHARC